MKKRITLICICLALSAITLASCATTKTLFSGSYWLTNSSNFGVANVNEVNDYTVNFVKAEGEGVPNVSIDSALSSFTTKLSTSDYDGTRCYLFETELKTVGSVTIASETTPIDDTVSTKVYFLGVDSDLKTLYSERTVVAHSVTTKSGKYVVELYNYKLTTKYEDKKATVDFQPTAECESYFDLDKGETVYDNYANTAYIDNELLLFAPRAMNLSESFSQEINSIDALAKSNRKLILATNSNKPTETIDLSDNALAYYRNNKRVRTVLTYNLQLAIQGSFSGSPLVLNYAAANETEELRCLEKLTTVSTGVGTFTYTINRAQTNEG